MTPIMVYPGAHLVNYQTLVFVLIIQAHVISIIDLAQPTPFLSPT